MADAVLQFTIKAKDEASRVVRSVTDGVGSDVKALDSTVGRLAQSFGLSDSKATALAKSLPLVGAAAGAVASVVAAAGAAIFTLAKNASDAGSEIFEAGQKTNLTAEFLSVLKVQAEQSGSTLEATAGKATKFANSLVDAARGNKDLTADLKRFGIDAADAYRNPERALKTFIEQFNKLPPSAANNEAAMKLFKDRTGEIIPVLRSMGTDVDELMEKLRASGQVWDREGTEKADEFGDALTEVGQIASGMANVFARETMPAITEAMKQISSEAIKNRDTFRVWGESVGNFIRGVRVVLDSEAGTIIGWLVKIAAAASPIYHLANATRALGAEANTPNPAGFGNFGPRGTATPLTTPAGSAPLAPGDIVNEAAAKEAARRREQERKESLRQIEAIEDAKARAYKRTIDTVRDAEREVLREIEAAKKEGERLDREAADRRIDAAERVRDALRAELAIITDENTHLTEINNTIRAAEILGAIDARTAAFARQLAVVNELARIAPGSDVLGGAAGALGVRDIPVGAGPMVDPAVFEEEFGKPPDFSPWETAIGKLRGVAEGGFKAIGAAMAQSAAAAFMYGQSFGKAMKAATQAALASIATMALVEAIKETALGFAKLAGFLPGPAALHFKAAALWAVAGVAAGGAAAAMGGSAGGAVAGSAFSAQPSAEVERDRTIREGRRGGASDPNQAAVMGYMTVDVKHDDGHVERQMVKVWRRMGEFRDTVMAGTVGTAPSY